MSYTPEPWISDEESGFPCDIHAEINGVLLARAFGDPVDALDGEANARRIVACVNACAGSPTEAIEEMIARRLTFGQLAFLYAELKESVYALPSGNDLRNAKLFLEQTVRQRDELLAAMETIARSLPQSACERAQMMDYANKVIASVKGGSA
jgi:hypothetical protein